MTRFAWKHSRRKQNSWGRTKFSRIWPIKLANFTL